jgi:putative ABC transport system permease protein
VLLGAIAAARAARIYDTVILRVLGASTRQLLALQLAEFGLLARCSRWSRSRSAERLRGW